MAGELSERIDRLLFAPASPLGLVVARVALALQALWIVLSRPGVKELTSWPAPFWNVPLPLRLRFLIFPGASGLDPVLYFVLIAALVAVAFGVLPRLMMSISAILLYHFAPMEAIVGGLLYTTSLGGLTLPALGLAILAFSGVPKLKNEPSSEYRWPLVMIQILFAFHYVNSGLAKFHWTGLRWYSGENFGGIAATLWTLNAQPLGLTVFRTPWLASALGAATFVLEFGFPLVIVSRWARWILLPAAVIAAFLRISVFGFFFLSVPSILLMVDWDSVAKRLLPARTTQASA
jgi:hypothetical protein